MIRRHSEEKNDNLSEVGNVAEMQNIISLFMTFNNNDTLKLNFAFQMIQFLMIMMFVKKFYFKLLEFNRTKANKNSQIAEYMLESINTDNLIS